MNSIENSNQNSNQSRREIKDIEHITLKVKNHLKKVYGERLDSVILYGSFAKNNATDDSDIDLAVILKGEVNPPKEINRIIDFISDAGLEYNELISIFPVSSESMINPVWPLYKSLNEEGIKI